MAPKMLTKLMGHKKSTTAQEERREEAQEQSQAPNPDTSEPLRRNPKRQATGGGSSSQQRKDKGSMNINVEDNPDPSRRPTREQLLNPCKGNRVLFRDDGAFTRFHGTCGEQRASAVSVTTSVFLLSTPWPNGSGSFLMTVSTFGVGGKSLKKIVQVILCSLGSFMQIWLKINLMSLSVSPPIFLAIL